MQLLLTGEFGESYVIEATANLPTGTWGSAAARRAAPTRFVSRP